MKNITIACLLLSLTFCAQGKTLAEGLRENIDRTITNPTQENVIALATEIKHNRRYSSELADDALVLTDFATTEICKIPGHAQFFADRIESMRASGKLTSTVRFECLVGTLPHLPSPEAVQVLGHYLSDETDKPSTPLPGQDWSNLPANCFLAADALGRIGLRNAPVTKNYLYQDRAVLEANRIWWEEIKSGKKSFSFKGQKVEYRFNPDGTWETLTLANPPDDAPKVTKIENRDKDRSQKYANLTNSNNFNFTQLPAKWWPWLGGGIAFFIGAILYLRIKPKA